MTTASDEFYRDIIEGLAIYTGSALQRDVLATISRHDEPDIGAALNKNQIASKMWLAESLLEAMGSDLGDVTILGGWFGVLAAVLLHDPRFAIGRVTSVDIDPRCAPIALAVNATHVRSGKFGAHTADMLDLDYGPAIAGAGDARRSGDGRRGTPDPSASRPGSGSSSSRTIISPATSTSTAWPISRRFAPRRRCARSCLPASGR